MAARVPGLLALAAASATAMPMAVAAQETAAPEPPRAPLLVERVPEGMVVAPDVRITGIDGRTVGVAGGYAGWMTDRSLLVGGGAYWVASGSSDLEMHYGGLVVEWLVRSDRRIGFGARALVGGGRATLGAPHGESLGLPLGGVDVARFGRASRPAATRAGLAAGVPPTAEVLVTTSFFVAEPQASLVWHVTRWCRVNLGAGYRMTAGAGPLDDRVHGASGSIAIQFGGS